MSPNSSEFTAPVESVDTRDPVAVATAVHCIYTECGGDVAFVPRAFDWALECFRGDHPDYLPIDVGYHDIEHTLQGALCLARLLRGYSRAAARPRLTVEAFELGILAILFHDAGYLKRRGDQKGTGAKYTDIHVCRSEAFARDFLAPKGLGETELRAIQSMIRCTTVVDAELNAIAFRSELERTVGYALATADLLGQLAAPDYVEKLPALFAEFAEGARSASAQTAHLYAYESAEALARNTPVYWERFVRPKLDHDFRGLYRFLNDPYPDGPNAYLQRVAENLSRLKR